jgi:hypothetical protein
MDRHEGIQTTLTIALHGGLYLVIIMDRYGVNRTPLKIALNGCLYLTITIYRYEGPTPHLQ